MKYLNILFCLYLYGVGNCQSIEVRTDSEKKSFSLPDGSTFYLNSQSYAKFPAVFTDTTRHIGFTGEIYVEVSRQFNSHLILEGTGTPTIYCQPGTHIGLSNYLEDSATLIRVDEGKAILYLEGNVTVLRANETFIHRQSEYSGWGPDYNSSWVHSDKYALPTNLHVLFHALSRNYGVNIIFGDLSGVGRINSGIYYNPKKDSLEAVLKLLTGTNKFKYKKLDAYNYIVERI